MTECLNTLSVGHLGEQQACEFLKTKGLHLITHNFRCKMGEIDLIMQDKNELVFVEVRIRNNTDFGSAAESVNFAKQKKIYRAATYYLQQNARFDKLDCRFDVVGMTKVSGLYKIEWIKNAFTLDD